GSPIHLAKTLHVLLQSGSVIEATDGADAVHLFWGHYPTVLIPLLRACRPDVPVSAFVGAYTSPDCVPSQRRCITQATAITTHFDDYPGMIRASWPELTTPIHLIHRGCDLELVRSIGARAGKKQHAKVLVVSRLVPEKRIAHAL